MSNADGSGNRNGCLSTVLSSCTDSISGAVPSWSGFVYYLMRLTLLQQNGRHDDDLVEYFDKDVRTMTMLERRTTGGSFLLCP